LADKNLKNSFEIQNGEYVKPFKIILII